MDAFSRHIEPKSRLIHDKEKSHRILVKELKLKGDVYDANEFLTLMMFLSTKIKVHTFYCHCIVTTIIFIPINLIIYFIS